MCCILLCGRNNSDLLDNEVYEHIRTNYRHHIDVWKRQHVTDTPDITHVGARTLYVVQRIDLSALRLSMHSH